MAIIQLKDTTWVQVYPIEQQQVDISPHGNMVISVQVDNDVVKVVTRRLS